MKDSSSSVRESASFASSSSASGTSNNNNSSSSSASGGIQLLSPTVQRAIEATTRKTAVRPLPAPPTSSNSKALASSRVTTAKGVDFDFDSFTLESVRATMHVSSSKRETNAGLSRHATKLADALDASPDGASSFHTMRSTEDFDALEHRRRNPSSASSGVSDPSGAKPAAAQRSHTGAEPQPASSRKRASIVTTGWLQKRKGVVLKRWKAYYCLLRDDDSLVLYASEDTINGRVEQRCQLLRVLLTDKTDAFHVISVGADGSPRKDEFRALHSVDWTRWFRALRRFVDAASLQGVLARKPELLALSPTHSSTGSDADDVAHDNNNSSSSTNGSGAVLWGLGATATTGKQAAAARTHSVRTSFEALGDEYFPARSTLSGWTNQSDEKLASSDAAASDCPMIEPHDARFPILDSDAPQFVEVRGSDSTASRDSDTHKTAGFSW